MRGHTLRIERALIAGQPSPATARNQIEMGESDVGPTKSRLSAEACLARISILQKSLGRIFANPQKSYERRTLFVCLRTAPEGYQAMTTTEANGTEQQAAPPPSPTDIIPESDPIAAAAETVEALRAKKAVLADRREVNKRASAELAFDAFTGNGKARKNLDDYNAEGLTLDREIANADSAIEEATRRHAAAFASQAAAQERDRAQQARERFNEFAQIAQQFSDAVDAVVQLYGELREASAAVHATGYGPAEAQITRWGQRLIVYRCQSDRLLRFEDLMVDGRERVWLERAPRDWMEKLMDDTARVLEPSAQAAE
jgi:hypothetical protein